MWHLNRKDGDARIVPALACAWERLENRLNRMRMKPEPKPIDTSKQPARRKSGAGEAQSFDPSA
jgi:hypothetical protein